MVISARVHYSCLAMLELARRAGDACPVAAGEISERHEIPGPFLNQILRALRSSGWVESIRGSHGGYRLVVDPKTITLLDIAEATGCQEPQHRMDDSTAAARTLCDIWTAASDSARAVLGGWTLADLVDRCQDHEDIATMFYI